MGTGKGKTDYLLSLIREGKQMTLGQQLRLTAYLSVPAIMAQISSIAMQYIDASMVGSLGANAAASIGLVSTTTWLFWELCAAAAMGFSVQVAHKIGAGGFRGEHEKYSASRLLPHWFSAHCWRLSAFPSVVCFPAGWTVMKQYGAIHPSTFGYSHFSFLPCS